LVVCVIFLMASHEVVVESSYRDESCEVHRVETLTLHHSHHHVEADVLVWI
jgi:hypothetical protein